MKKIIAQALAVLVLGSALIAVVGCSGEKKEETPPATTETPTK